MLRKHSSTSPITKTCCWCSLNRKQIDHELTSAERLVAAVSRHPKADGHTVADWERKKKTSLARGHWLCGIAHSEKQQYYEADKDLRMALPRIQGNEAVQAPALFHLGVVNYQLDKWTLN